jgi:uncharacterized protein YbbC (DUF1343 family)
VRTPRVATGLDVLAARDFAPLKGRRVGLIANPSSVDRRMRHAACLLRDAPDVELTALFGPEHGLDADAQDMIAVDEARDHATGLPVHSLYGSDPSSLAPTAAMLDGLDALVFDLQDVGSRYYTFAATMLYALEAAARSGLAFFVLDRPNPLGGTTVAGPTIQPGFESFIGPHPLPIRHGMTVGELARLFCEERRIDLDLTVLPCEGWRRSMAWEETGLVWVAPSPNMPTVETARVYPGGCLIEGTNLSEGRGTTHPFEWWGAPWLDPAEMTRRVGEVPGAYLRPCAFRPVFHKHAGKLCRGLQPHVIDDQTFEPILLYVEFLAEARRQGGERFAWRTEPYEFIEDPIAIDLLFGSSRERTLIDSGWGHAERDGLRAAWAAESAAFASRREPFLLYEP